MSIKINDNLEISGNKPVDSRYLNVSLPWNSISEVNNSIPISYRYTGLTVNILGSEYWYNNGIDDINLVVKSNGGGFGNVVNGLSLINGGNTITLGGVLTGDTIFNGGVNMYTLQYGGNYASNYTLRSLVDKEYVDSITSGLKPRQAVIVATTENIGLSGLTTIDGITLNSGDRVLVKDQLNRINNGVYSASTGAWNRTSDFNTGVISSGMFVFTLSGNTNKNYAFVLITQDPINVGVSEIEFIPFFFMTLINGGVGINTNMLSGNTYVSFDGANVAGTCLSWNGTQLGLNSTSANVISNGLTGATNGLTRLISRKIGLGGVLTGNTLISLPYSSESCFAIGNGNISSSWYGGNLVLCRSNTSISSNMMFLGVYGDANNYSSICGNPTTGIRLLTTVDNVSRSVLINSSGLTYGGCYHSSYVNRSLVDKEYVDNLTGSIGATNGLTRNNDNIVLGGLLTGNTSILGTSGTSLYLGGNVSNKLNSLSINTISGITLNTSCVQINFSNGGLITDSSINPNGLRYDGCYHSSYVNRSLVDKEYVDNQIVCTSISGASNGLSLTCSNVVLGGNLLNSTVINTCNNSFCFASDSINSYAKMNLNLRTNYSLASVFIGATHSGLTGSWWSTNMTNSLISLNHYSNTNNGSNVIVYDTGITLSNKTSNFDKVVKLGVCGLTYGDNYCNSYSNRSLVDKEYVDRKVSGTSNIINVNNIGINYYETTQYDDFVGVSGASCVYLYDAPVIGQRVSIVDICGNALLDPIRVDGNGKKINDDTISMVNTNYGSITYVYNGYCWSAIAFVN